MHGTLRHKAQVLKTNQRFYRRCHLFNPNNLYFILILFFHMIFKVARTLNPENGELSYTNDQAAVRDLRSSPEPLNREGLSTLQDNQIPMTYKKTTPTPEDQNQVMKAVVGGSAADILLAMAKSRLEQTKHSQSSQNFHENQFFQ